jgi:hypothetical protein
MRPAYIVEIIEGLIKLSQRKYGLVKVGKETLTEDILFIEQYEKLKSALEVDQLEAVDIKAYPQLGELKRIIQAIHDYENNQPKKNVKINQAMKAYKK